MQTDYEKPKLVPQTYNPYKILQCDQRREKVFGEHLDALEKLIQGK